MTKNRKTKRSIRTVADRLGINYTTARRAHDKDAATSPINTSSLEAKSALGPWRLQCGPDPDGRPAYLDLGHVDGQVITYIGGGAGTGKTRLVHHIARLFQEQTTTAQVVWLGESSNESSTLPYFTLDADRTTVLDPYSPTIGEDLTAPLDTSTNHPTLVIVDAADFLLVHGRTSDDTKNALDRLARLGRSKNVRVILTSQRNPDRTLLTLTTQEAASTRILLGYPAREGDWTSTFGDQHTPPNPANPATPARLQARCAWVQHGDTQHTPQPWTPPTSM